MHAWSRALFWIDASDRALRARVHGRPGVRRTARARRRAASGGDRRVGAVSVVRLDRPRVPVVSVGRAACSRAGSPARSSLGRATRTRRGRARCSCARSRSGSTSNRGCASCCRAIRPGGASPRAGTTSRRSRYRRGSAGTRINCRGDSTSSRLRPCSASSSSRRGSHSRRAGFGAGRSVRSAVLQLLIAVDRQLRLLQRADGASIACGSSMTRRCRDGCTCDVRPRDARRGGAASRPRHSRCRCSHSRSAEVAGRVRRAPAAVARAGVPRRQARAAASRELVRPVRGDDDRRARRSSSKARDDGEDWTRVSVPLQARRREPAPGFVAPHQPRLDWQMWFAALGSRRRRWFASLLARLLEGSPDVLALFAGNPFPARPPTFVRALLYEYRMADRATRRRTDAWWSASCAACTSRRCARHPEAAWQQARTPASGTNRVARRRVMDTRPTRAAGNECRSSAGMRDASSNPHDTRDDRGPRRASRR